MSKTSLRSPTYIQPYIVVAADLLCRKWALVEQCQTLHHRTNGRAFLVLLLAGSAVPFPVDIHTFIQEVGVLDL